MKPVAGLKTPLHRSDWTTSRLKFLLERKSRPLREDDWVVTAFRDGVVTLRANRREDGFTFAEKEIGYQGVEPGDLVIHAMDGFAGAIGVSDSRGKCSPVCTIIVPRPEMPVHTRYWGYYLRNLAITGFIESLAKGIRERSTDFRWKDAGNLLVNYPDLPTQRRIADFLDRETARIDLLIEKKQRLVALQSERHQSTLQRLVLGGARISRTAGRDWIEALPSEWQIFPLKHLVSVYGGATPSKDREDYWQGEVPWVSPKDMKQDLLDSASHYISEAALMNSPLVMVPEDSVLIVVRGMILARNVPICRLNMPATINQDMKALVARTTKITPKYLQAMMQGFQSVLMSFVEEAAHGTKKLRSDQLFSLKFPVPPLEVQASIVNTLSAALNQMERSNMLVDQSLDRLREYRAALITAAVTGQIDVDSHTRSGATDRRLDSIQEELGA